MSEFPTPKTQKQIRSFLGTANYYSRFIPNFEKNCNTIECTFVQREKVGCDVALKTLKNKLVSAPILSYPDPNRTFILTYDALDTSVRLCIWSVE